MYVRVVECYVSVCTCGRVLCECVYVWACVVECYVSVCGYVW